MTSFALKDELLDAQALRVAGAAGAGGSDIGECLATCARVAGNDLASWHREWTRTAERLLEDAESDLCAGRTISARDGFFRASNYLRNAGVMFMGNPLDARLTESNRRQSDAFRRGAALLTIPPDVIEIPFEDTALPGYFFRCDTCTSKRPTVILTGGYDGTAEELFFLTGAAALARGYHVLAFDGPGQGAALIDRGLLLRPDWDYVVGSVIDVAVTRPEVDSDRIALIGLSLGAHLAPRAAAYEHRLAACIADGGSFDLFESALARMPGFLRRGYLEKRPLHSMIVKRALDVLEGKPTAGWALRRGQQVHGAESPMQYIEMLREYSLKRHAPKIKCPTLVCNAEGDDISESASELFAALTCPKQMITFSTADGAGDHCEAGARSLFHARSFAWLDQVLSPA